MAENVIAVGIAVRCHAVTHTVQFFYRLALLDPAQIPFQAPVYIIQICMHCLVQRILLRCGRLSFYSGTVDQIRLFEPLHLPEYLCRIQSIRRLSDHTLFQTAEPAFHRVFPLLVRDIKEIRKDMHMDSPAIAVA